MQNKNWLVPTRPRVYWTSDLSRLNDTYTLADIKGDQTFERCVSFNERVQIGKLVLSLTALL